MNTSIPHTLKSYLITSTTKVNAVKNFNLRSEKEEDAPISKFHLTSELDTEKQKQSHPWPCRPSPLHALCLFYCGWGRPHTAGPNTGVPGKGLSLVWLAWSRAVLLMIHTGPCKATHTALWHQGSLTSTLKGSLQTANPSWGISWLSRAKGFWGCGPRWPMCPRAALTHVRHMTELGARPHYQEQKV